MLTTIAAAVITGFAGVAIGASYSSSGMRRRIGQLEEVIPELVTRTEVSQAFAQLAAIEQQRQEAARQARWQAQAMQAPAPVFRTEAASGTFQAETSGRPQPAPPAADVNALLNQQLAALNERLQQVTSQRMPT